MPYATIDDVRKQIRESELIGLTDEEDTGAVDTAKVDNALADASAEIDGYLGDRHALPLSSVPAILTKLEVDIAIYNLYGESNRVPETRQKRYDNAVKFLEKVAKGEISLGANDPDGSGSGDTAEASSSAKVFTSETLKNF